MTTLRYGSVCSGIEAATVAWHPLGWQAAWYSEIEPFPCAVLAHHYPTVPNLGDMTQHKNWPTHEPIELLVGGTPCQAFSVAGLRKGLADPRGNLTLTYLAIAAQYRPKWLVWENVPGVLSDQTGAFGALLGGLAELGYGFAYRVLDAQYFGVAQRRRRVFVVGHLGDWRRAAAVLLERQSLSGNHAPRRQTREGTAHSVAGCLGSGGKTAGSATNQDAESGLLIPSVSRALNCHRSTFTNGDIECGTLLPVAPAMGSANPTAVAYGITDDETTLEECLPTMPTPSPSGGGHPPAVSQATAVRRLTPRECERLQGFPDDYTLIPYRNKPAADGPRYKALGNSMAVPVMHWIGQRIQLVEQLDP
jgi:DNA (cytosine-5)-methyltransferase 1